MFYITAGDEEDDDEGLAEIEKIQPAAIAQPAAQSATPKQVRGITTIAQPMPLEGRLEGKVLFFIL